MDSKMDTKSGMQLGICWVKFDAPPTSSGKTAHDIAKTVVKICDGQRIRMQGDEKIRVVLDGRGLRAQKAVKEEMERRYKPKPKPVPKAAPPPSPVIATPASGADTPKTESTLPPKPTPAGLPNRPTPRPVPFFNNRDYASLGRAQPIRPTFQSSKLPGRPAFGAGQGAQRTNPTYTTLPYSRPGKSIDLRDSWEPGRDRGRSRSRSRSRSRDGRGSRSRYRSVSRHSSHTSGCSTCPSDSEYSDDDRHYRSRGRRRAATPPKREKKPTGPSKEDEAAMEKVKKALAENGKSHIFIDETTLSTKDISTSEYLRDHFRAFHPKQVSCIPLR
jgi:histone-lysine N-methyltransferase SETD1